MQLVVLSPFYAAIANLDVSERPISFHKNFDPVISNDRIQIMLAGTATVEKPKRAAIERSAERRSASSDRGSKKKVAPSKMSEDTHWVELVVRIRAQDKEAFRHVFQHFAPRVKAFLIKSGADVGMAEECAQDVMATLWHKAHMFDPTRASVSTWIFTIARNRRIDMLRKQRRPEPDELMWGPEPEPDGEEVVGLQQETERLSEALSQLPEKQRDLIQRAYFGDLSHSEIAEETGLPLGTIKSRIRLALERLRHQMK